MCVVCISLPTVLSKHRVLYSGIMYCVLIVGLLSCVEMWFQALNKEIEDYKRQISQNAVEVALLKSDLDSLHNPSPRTNSSNSVAKLEENITKLQVPRQSLVKMIRSMYHVTIWYDTKNNIYLISKISKLPIKSLLGYCSCVPSSSRRTTLR